MEKKEEDAGGGGANIKSAKQKSGIHNLKRKYEELKAKFDNVEKNTRRWWHVLCYTP